MGWQGPMTHFQRLGWQVWLDPKTDLSLEGQDEMPDWDLRVQENERMKAELAAEREGGIAVAVKRGQIKNGVLPIDVAQMLQERSDKIKAERNG